MKASLTQQGRELEALNLRAAEALADPAHELTPDPGREVLGGRVVDRQDDDFVARHEIASVAVDDFGMAIVARIDLQLGMLTGQQPVFVQEVA